MEKKKVLIVEDIPHHAYEAGKSLHKDNEISFAFDLEDAIKRITEQKPDIILTDMGFHERGLREYGLDDAKNLEKNLFGLEDIPSNKALTEAYVNALSKSRIEEKKNAERLSRGKYEAFPINSDSKIEELQKLVLNEEILLTVLSEIYHQPLEKTKEDVSKGISKAPPMGYYVIQESKKKGIPVVVVTDPGHGSAYLPVLTATGIEDVNGVVEAYQTARAEHREGNYNFLIPLKSGNVVFSPAKPGGDWVIAFHLALKKKYR